MKKSNLGYMLVVSGHHGDDVGVYYGLNYISYNIVVARHDDRITNACLVE